MRLSAADDHLTEIYMLDHSVFPFLCVNVIQQHQQVLRRHETRLEALEAKSAISAGIEPAHASGGPHHGEAAHITSGSRAVEAAPKAWLGEVLASRAFQVLVAVLSVLVLFSVQLQLTAPWGAAGATKAGGRLVPHGRVPSGAGWW